MSKVLTILSRTRRAGREKVLLRGKHGMTGRSNRSDAMRRRCQGILLSAQWAASAHFAGRPAIVRQIGFISSHPFGHGHGSIVLFGGIVGMTASDDRRQTV